MSSPTPDEARPGYDAAVDHAVAAIMEYGKGDLKPETWQVIRVTMNVAMAAAYPVIVAAVETREPDEFRVMCQPPDREVRPWSITRTGPHAREAIDHDMADCIAEGRWGRVWIEERASASEWVAKT